MYMKPGECISTESDEIFHNKSEKLKFAFSEYIQILLITIVYHSLM
jgi:hypothetical protein